MAAVAGALFAGRPAAARNWSCSRQRDQHVFPEIQIHIGMPQVQRSLSVYLSLDISLVGDR